MPGTVTPAQMYDHELNVLKGWPSPYAVEKPAKIDATETLTILAGRCCYLTASGGLKMGCPYNKADALAPMPMWAWPNSSDFDVSGDVGNTISGTMMALPAKGAYEFETTEFKGTGFLPNQALCADAGSTAADRGLVKCRSLAATGSGNEDMVVGIVSTGPKGEVGIHTNSYGKSVVSFWPVYLPLVV